jgi:hypothetical protein
MCRYLTKENLLAAIRPFAAAMILVLTQSVPASDFKASWRQFNRLAAITCSGLPGNNCTPLAVDRNGKLWVAFLRTETRYMSTWIKNSLIRSDISLPAGIACYDGRVWTPYTTLNSGLPSNAATCAEIIDATVYIGTDAGLGIFRTDPSEIVNRPEQTAITPSRSVSSVTLAGNNVRYILICAGRVLLSTYDLHGRLIGTYCAGSRAAGTHLLPLSELFKSQTVGSGILVLRISAGEGHPAEYRLPMVRH